MIYATDKLFLLFVTGSKAFKELETVINSKYLLKDIPKLSSSHQTSLVEVLQSGHILCPEAHSLLLSGNESKVACYMPFCFIILLALIIYYYCYFLL